MNEEKNPSVIISGLGISGLITASLLCKEKIKVECFEPINISKFHADQRTTAFLNPAIGIFKEIGIWEKIEPFSQPLKEMEIIESVHEGLKPFKCEKCSTFFTLKNSLKNHIAFIHDGKKPFECIRCKNPS